MNGSCQCSQMSFSLDGEPLFVYACHCSQCQKRTCSAFSMGMVIEANALQLEGELTAWERVSTEGNTNTRYSCRDCGNIIYGASSNSPNLLKLQPGTLDNNRDIHPEVHIWVQNSQRRVSLPADVPQYDTQPESQLELLQAVETYRTSHQGE